MAAVLYEMHPELRKWLSLAEVEAMALDVLTEGDDLVPGEVLAEAEGRLVRLAGFYDRAEARPVHHLLLAVFRYSYLKGLAKAVFGDLATGVLGFVLRRDVLPAVWQFHAEMQQAGIPVPAADSRFLLRLHDAGRV